jgi:hypothetical protein
VDFSESSRKVSLDRTTMRLLQHTLFSAVLCLLLVGLTIGAFSEQPADFSVELTWQGTADLDLVVTTPSGYRVSYANQTVGGGTLEADSNGYCVHEVQQPIERVMFPASGSSPGAYFVTINYALPCGEGANPVQWHLTIRSGNEVTERSGEITLGESLPIGRFLRS